MNDRRILIVEDERIVALDIKSRLVLQGYSVCDLVHTGSDAIRVAGEMRPDLVLMDIMLENGMDGIEAAEQIRLKYDIPVIFLSAYSDELTIQRAKITEPYGYLLKPFDGKDLHTVIEMALYKHTMESKLKGVERWLTTTVKSIGDGVITTDKGRLVTFMNPVAEALTGWQIEEAVSRELGRLFTIISEDTNDVIEDPVSKVIAGGSVAKDHDAVLLNRHGYNTPISFTAAPIQDESGNTSGVVFILRDITLRKKAEMETRETLQKLRVSMNALIDALAHTVETRDPYTAGHQRRVTNLARAIATEMGLHIEQVDGIRMAGVIHDLGKISVPAEILTKPSKLIPIEYSLIQTHAQIGYDILKSIDFPWPVAEIVYQHHEKMNGTGYPRGLTGGDLLLESRVLTVADVVEAMASHRPYRAALGIEQSLDEIVKNRSVLYDPDVVDACVRVFNERGFQFQ
jgi:PAS domain S-box-containing protein/putative nucleotidyltransferase with HDIG domain